MSPRAMTVLGVLVILANLIALLASIGAGMWGLLPANLLGLGCGVVITARLLPRWTQGTTTEE